MKIFDKRKLNSWSRRHLNADNIKISILFFPLLIILIQEWSGGEFKITDYLSLSILLSFILVFVCELISVKLSKLILRKTEDAMKLSDDYSYLIDKYCSERGMITTKEGVCLPIGVLCTRKIKEKSFNFSINHKNRNNKYKLPSQIASNSESIFKAHDCSKIYNSFNIRLDNIVVSDNKDIELYYSQTTYFDSLLTNRALDYPFNGILTARELYEPGPYLSHLSESKLSNHLGFNGFIELKDKSIIFIRRGSEVSVAKETWASSIAASLKVKYAMDNEQKLTVEGLSNAIRNEIRNELKIDIPLEEDLSKSIFAFYRDIVEGGKPQFLFYYKTDLFNNREDFEKNFRQVTSTKDHRSKNKKELIIDGNKFEYFTIEMLKIAKFGVDSFKSKDGTEYKMTPSSIASILLLLEAI